MYVCVYVCMYMCVGMCVYAYVFVCVKKNTLKIKKLFTRYINPISLISMS